MNEETIGCFSKPFASSPEAVKNLLGGITILLANEDLNVSLADLYYKDLTANVKRRLVPPRCIEAAQVDLAVLVVISEFLNAGV